MMAETGASGLTPAATTRERKSRLVTIPSFSRERTRTALAPSAVICFAASRIGGYFFSREARSGLRPSNRSDQLGLGELAVADQHLHGLEPAFPLTAAREHAAR